MVLLQTDKLTFRLMYGKDHNIKAFLEEQMLCVSRMNFDT